MTTQRVILLRVTRLGLGLERTQQSQISQSLIAAGKLSVNLRQVLLGHLSWRRARSQRRIIFLLHSAIPPERLYISQNQIPPGCNSSLLFIANLFVFRPMGQLALLVAVIHQHTPRAAEVTLPSPVPHTTGRTGPLEDLSIDDMGKDRSQCTRGRQPLDSTRVDCPGKLLTLVSPSIVDEAKLHAKQIHAIGQKKRRKENFLCDGSMDSENQTRR